MNVRHAPTGTRGVLLPGQMYDGSSIKVKVKTETHAEVTWNKDDVKLIIPDSLALPCGASLAIAEEQSIRKNVDRNLSPRYVAWQKTSGIELPMIDGTADIELPENQRRRRTILQWGTDQERSGSFLRMLVHCRSAFGEIIPLPLAVEELEVQRQARTQWR